MCLRAPYARPAALVVALLCGSSATASCRKSSAPAPSEREGAPAPSQVSSAVVPAASAAVPAPSTADAPPEPAPCRALRVTGSVRTAEGKLLAKHSELDGTSWLELEKGAELVVRHGVSARELSLFGPGRALPCRFGQEQILLIDGRLESSQGTGVRPGAEVWVATPFGSIRYADAKLTLSSQRDGLQLSVRSGQAFAESVEGLRGAGEGGQVTGPSGRASLRARNDPAATVQGCERAAHAASDSAQQLFRAEPAELGKLAAAQLRTRRLARGRCLAAQTAVASLTDPEEKARLGDQVQRADALWQGVPAPPGKAGLQGPERSFPGPE